MDADLYRVAVTVAQHIAIRRRAVALAIAQRVPLGPPLSRARAMSQSEIPP